MKKIYLFTVLVMAGFAVQAQRADIGLKGGLNLATWSNNGSGAAYQNRLGFNGGLFAKIFATPQLSIQPEVVYSSQGTKYTVGSQEHDLKLNYVNIPVMLQANVGGGLYAEAGPQLGFLIGTADKVGDYETDYFTTNDFKKNDVAIGLGLGYAGTSGFGVNARYNLGLTNINNVGTNKIKNNVLQVGLTMRLSGNGGRRY